MANGYAAAFVVSFETSDLEKLNLPTYQKFTELLIEHNIEIEDFSNYVEHDGLIEEVSEENIKLVDEAYREFQEEFKQHHNIAININYHNGKDSGDIYDGVDGTFYELDFSEVYTLTPQAKELQKILPFEITQYVKYG